VAEHLSDDEQVEALRRWWSQNGTTLIVTLVLVILGVIGWRWYHDHKAATEAAASAAYRHYLDVRASATATDADRAAALAPLDGEFKGSTYHVFALLYRAHDAADSGDYAQAGDLLDAAVSAADGVLRDVARIRLARVQLQLGKVDAALASLAAVSGGGFRGEVAELKGDVLLSQGDRAGALEAYRSAAAAEPGQRHPMLDMKIADLAPPHAAQP
jgi:predicted negative regulator of RcsB-dependent stress response